MYLFAVGFDNSTVKSNLYVFVGRFCHNICAVNALLTRSLGTWLYCSCIVKKEGNFVKALNRYQDDIHVFIITVVLKASQWLSSPP